MTTFQAETKTWRVWPDRIFQRSGSRDYSYTWHCVYGRMSRGLSSTSCLCSSKFYGRSNGGVVRGPADTLQRGSEFHTHVCMCKACESSIRRSLKKHRYGEPFRFRWDEGNESVAFHFVRQLMLKLASMLCVGIGRIVCSTSLQLCLCTQHYQLVYFMKNVRKSDTMG